MNREAFAAVCHTLAIVLRIAGYSETAAHLRALEDQAGKSGWGWSKTRATGALIEALGVMQDELAERLAAHH